MGQQVELGLLGDPAIGRSELGERLDRGPPGARVAGADPAFVGVPATCSAFARGIRPEISAPFGARVVARRYLSRVAAEARTACAAASRATGTRNGEHET